MLGRIPPYVLGPVGLIIILGLLVAGFWFMVKPKQQETGEIKAQIEEQENKAAQRERAEADLARVRRQWEAAHDGLALKMDERSIPISMGQPLIAMMNLWDEVRESLPPLVEKFVRASGCVMVTGHPGWNPPMDPFPPNTAWIEFPIGPTQGTGTVMASASGTGVGAAAGGMGMGMDMGGDAGMPGMGGPVGGGQAGAPIWVAGSLADIERLYKSLRNFPRIATVQHLGLIRLRDMMDTAMYDTVRELIDRPVDEIVVAPLIMSIWLMCETPEAAPAAAPAPTPGAPGAPGPGGPPGMGMPGEMPQTEPSGEGMDMDME